MKPRVPSLAEARQTGAKHYSTGKPCARGHLSQRLVSTRKCLECCKEDCAKWRGEEKNAEWLRKRCLENYHKEPIRSRETSKKWKKDNKSRVNDYISLQKKRIRQATPYWSDLEAIEEVYLKAQLASEATGEQHDVDHIVPIKGRNVCGLHVPLNLRVLHTLENRRKSNRLIEELVKDQTNG